MEEKDLETSLVPMSNDSFDSIKVTQEPKICRELVITCIKLEVDVKQVKVDGVIKLAVEVVFDLVSVKVKDCVEVD